MAEIILLVVFSVPAILGLAEIIHSVKLFLVSPKIRESGVLVILPDNSNFDRQLLNAAEQRNWYGSRFAKEILVLDSLLDEENKTECRKLADRLGLGICDGSGLTDRILGDG